MEKYTFEELKIKYGWTELGPSASDRRVQFANMRGVKIEPLTEKRDRKNLFKIVEEFKVYTKQELIDKFNLQTKMKNPDAKALIKYCSLRGIVIEKVANLKNQNVFRILEDNRTLDGEIWKFLEKEQVYVSNLGRVKNASEKLLSLEPGTQGYVSIHIQNPEGWHRVHRLVMMAFNPIDNPEYYDVDHINGIRSDNRVENLRWVTCKQNLENRDNNQTLIGNIVADYIQKYGYDEVYSRIMNLFD